MTARILLNETTLIAIIDIRKKRPRVRFTITNQRIAPHEQGYHTLVSRNYNPADPELLPSILEICQNTVKYYKPSPTPSTPAPQPLNDTKTAQTAPRPSAPQQNP